MTKYEKIANDLRNEILNNKDIKKLPTENQLMKTYSSSKNTIRSAISILINDGLIYPIHGSGLYIRPRQEGTIRLRNTRGFASEHPGEKMTRTILDFQLLECNEGLAEKLECLVKTPIYFIKRLMFIDDVAFAVEYTYYNKDIVLYLNADIAEKSIFSYIINDLKLSIGFSEKIVSALPLIEKDQKLLNLEKGAFGLIIDDNTFLSDGTKFNYSRIWYNYKYAHFFDSDII